MPDYYQLLGVPPTATRAEIKKAYRALAARYHPDKHRGNDLEDLAREKLAQLNQAYEVLSDESRRADYDRERRMGGRFSSSSPPVTPPVTSFFGSVMRLMVILAAAFLTLRFVRSPRAIAVIGVAILIAWFGPRLFRRLKRRK